ncbi:MAG: nicotinate-nucleotide adenylyltransferase [Hyphomicrobiaceae bacterium]
MSERLGILGGTFDPVHLGHTTSAIEVADAFSLSQVRLVVSALPPHKHLATAATADQRLAMVELACRVDPRLQASNIEMLHQQPSYTVDTLATIRASCPATTGLWFIIGIDAWREVDSWSRPERLLELANLIVTSRPGDAETHPEPRPPFADSESTCYDPDIQGYRHISGHILVGHIIDGIDVSSTEIRQRLQDAGNIEDLTGPEVSAYIHQHRLYEAPS